MSGFTNGNFIWFVGVCEDIMDPQQANRVKVRIYGYHSADTSVLSTDSLPWAIVGMPTTASGVSGIYQSPHGILQGSHVIGFFLDGDHKQTPCVISTFAGIPASKTGPTGGGFVDPSGTYPTYVGDSDVSKYARGKAKPSNSLVNSNGISEPDSGRNPQYPKNKSYLGESGHLFEIDDTGGAERILLYHASGSFIEWHASGDIVYKSPSNTYDLTAGNKAVNIGGNAIINVGGNATINVSGNCTETVSGNYNLNIGGSWNIKVGASYTLNSGGSQSFQSGGVSQTQAPMIRLN